VKYRINAQSQTSYQIVSVIAWLSKDWELHVSMKMSKVSNMKRLVLVNLCSAPENTEPKGNLLKVMYFITSLFFLIQYWHLNSGSHTC
jgi:hypothetical protein